MTTRRLGATALVGIVAAAAFLIAGAALDSSALSVVGALAVLVVFAAREMWLWRGQGRLWLMMIGGLAAVIVAAFLAQKLTG